MNTFKNYIPNKIITCNDKDPPWINDEVKILIKLQKVILNNYIKNGRKSEDCDLLTNTSQQLSVIINNRKASHYSHLTKKFNDPKTSNKAFWSILKTFVNDKKIPVIPPLLVNSQFITDVSSKANLFNTYFSQ